MPSKSATAAGVRGYACSGMQRLLEAGVHFFFFNELATVGLRDALTDGRAEPGFLLKQAQGDILDQMRGGFLTCRPSALAALPARL
jgi:hypothetical protein